MEEDIHIMACMGVGVGVGKGVKREIEMEDMMD